MQYNQFRYLYPPRTETKTNPDKLGEFGDEYLGQPKYNGSCITIATNGDELHLYNRHRQLFSKPVAANVDFRALASTGKWFVFAAEYLNKAQVGEHGTVEKDKAILWDVLVWDGIYLVGQTLHDRLMLLESAFPSVRNRVNADGRLEGYDHICLTDIPGIYKAPTYIGQFAAIYNSLVQVPLYEGLVLKKAASKLEYGYNERNNTGWQIKIRKENKLYNF